MQWFALPEACRSVVDGERSDSREKAPIGRRGGHQVVACHELRSVDDLVVIPGADLHPVVLTATPVVLPATIIDSGADPGIFAPVSTVQMGNFASGGSWHQRLECFT